MNKSRRQLLKLAGSAGMFLPFAHLHASKTVRSPIDDNNFFQQIYNDKDARTIFNRHLLTASPTYIHPMLPDKILEELTERKVDKIIYKNLQSSFVNKELGADYKFQNAIHTQEYIAHVIEQTSDLLNYSNAFEKLNGHMDLGSNSAYINNLWQALPLSGQLVSIAKTDHVDPTMDMFSDKQMTHVGQTLSIEQYEPKALQSIPAQSLSIITAFQGFDICALQLQTDFIHSAVACLKPGGHLIIQKPSMTSNKNYTMTVLSRYIQNLQNGVSWEDNYLQNRPFRSMVNIQRQFSRYGMVLKNSRIVYPDDPVSDVLMHFQKA